MHISSQVKHVFSLTNMTVGFVVSLIAVYLFITGDYDNLAARQEQETMLNLFVLGGLVYGFAFCFYDAFQHSPKD